MRRRWNRSLFKSGLPWRVLIVAVSLSGLSVCAAEIRLKSGVLLFGKKLVLDKMAGTPVGEAGLKEVKDAAPTPHHIVILDTGWQHFYFPALQQQTILPSAPLPATFKIPLPKRPGGRLTVTSLGALTNVDPFDEFGRRRVTLATPNKQIEVFQAISEVATDHVMVESLNYDWKLGISLKSIPVETLDKLLRKQFKADDVKARFGLIRLLIQAEHYKQAFDELDAIGRDFAGDKDMQEMVEKSKADHEKLMNYFGSEILNRLKKRKRAGQHELAETYAKALVQQPLSGAVEQDVRQYLRSYEESRRTIERAKLLLADWQAKLNDAEQEKLLQPLRSEINDQLDFETLPRLTAFLNAEADNQYKPSQRLALAYSGWLLGSENADPDLDQVFRMSDARQSVLEFLRTDDPSRHIELLKKLQSSENVSAGTVVKLTPQLPPVIENTDIVPSIAHHVQSKAGESFSYWVMLPPEYSPHHQYPLLMALRPAHRAAEEALEVWANINSPDYGNQRGYIVIAPDYVERAATEYTFGAPAHKAVLDCLIDARKRFAVDSDRVYLAGHGMGGDAAFDIGMAHPDEFAGVIPVGGNAINYCKFNWENGRHTSWCAIGRAYDSNGNRDLMNNKSDPVIDNIMKAGAKFDFLYVEYMGRNGEDLLDEIPKFYEWMDLPSHTRRSQPKQFRIKSLRKTDNRFFWVTAHGLPHDYVLPVAGDNAQRILPMDFDIRANPGNIIHLPRLPDKYTLRLTPEIVDFDRRVRVEINNRSVFNNFVTPDIAVLLDELHLRGDRKRLPLAIISTESGKRATTSSHPKSGEIKAE